MHIIYVGVRMLFCKMNGLGNDYIFFESSKCNNESFNYLKENIVRLTRLLSNRNFGIGSDGVVLVEDSIVADAKMSIFNADGTEALMCGNALRCVGKLIYEKRKYTNDTYTIETPSGIKKIKIIDNNPRESIIETEMGMPTLIKREDEIEFYNIGNNHAVFYADELDDKAIAMAQNISLQYDLNVEAVSVVGDKISMRVWERGSGETLACGTGASCVAFSAMKRGLCNGNTNIYLKGGQLLAKLSEEGISLVGKANINYIGEINLDYYG